MRLVQLILGIICLCSCSLLQAQYASGKVDLNKVSAQIYSCGDISWTDQCSLCPIYEVPKDSGMHTIYAGNLWIGGRDPQGELRVAGYMYQGNGGDFWPGPIMDSASYAGEASKWDRVWKVSKSEIDYHQANWNSAGYTVPMDIEEWPAHGDTTIGQAADLAPFYDRDNDGSYNPSNGDYPLIKGDQSIYFIYNDDWKLHYESGGKKLGVEVHVMAYVVEGDSLLDHTVFLNYKIINRSQNTYDDTYTGVFLDLDIGNPNDDFLGSDVQRGAFFGYNGDSFDEDASGVLGYGDFPPAQSVVFMAGPWQDADGKDNAEGIGPFESINGYGYGDTIIDNERLGLTNFMVTGSGTWSPQTDLEFYNMMTSKGLKYDGSTVDAKYMYPGTSDPMGYGTGGVPQAEWSEETNGNGPGDRRGIGTSGPFTFEAGEEFELDLSLVFARSSDTSISSVELMKESIDYIRNEYESELAPPATGNKVVDIHEGEMKVYTNPFKNSATVEFDLMEQKAQLEVYDITGRKVKDYKIGPGRKQVRLHAEDLTSGVFFLRLINEEGILGMEKIIVFVE